MKFYHPYSSTVWKNVRKGLTYLKRFETLLLVPCFKIRYSIVLQPMILIVISIHSREAVEYLQILHA